MNDRTKKRKVTKREEKKEHSYVNSLRLRIALLRLSRGTIEHSISVPCAREKCLRSIAIEDIAGSSNGERDC